MKHIEVSDDFYMFIKKTAKSDILNPLTIENTLRKLCGYDLKPSSRARVSAKKSRAFHPTERMKQIALYKELDNLPVNGQMLFKWEYSPDANIMEALNAARIHHAVIRSTKRTGNQYLREPQASGLLVTRLA